MRPAIDCQHKSAGCWNLNEEAVTYLRIAVSLLCRSAGNGRGRRLTLGLGQFARPRDADSELVREQRRVEHRQPAAIRSLSHIHSRQSRLTHEE